MNNFKGDFNFTKKSFQRQSDIHLGLERILSFLENAGNPQKNLKNIIHIAGTNGKGSTLCFLEALLRKAGYNVGRYISPHLIRIEERFLFNGNRIRPMRLTEIEKELALIDGFSDLTYFEALTAIAFQYFSEENPDYLLLETGLGGRLDATNVIEKPILTLITQIDLDHQEFLGNSIEEIAFEKAGIIKETVPWISTAQPRAKRIIAKIAATKRAPELPLRPLPGEAATHLGLTGLHQAENATLAYSAFFELMKEHYSSVQIEKLASEGLCQPQNWSGRFQQINVKRIHNKKVILDGAHNPSAAKALRKTLDSLYPQQNFVWLIGIMKRKAAQDMLSNLLKPGDKVFGSVLKEGDSNCSWDITELETVCHSLQADFIAGYNDPREAFLNFLAFLNSCEDTSVGVVSGSLYLVGNVLELIEGEISS